MKTVSQFEVVLSQVAFLLEQQRYDEALPLLGYLLKTNPSDRETRLYRQLVVRILVLRHGLTHPAPPSAKSAHVLARIVRKLASAFRSRKMPESAVRDDDPASISSGDRHSQLQSELAAATQEIDKLTIGNKELLEERNSLSSKLAASEKSGEDLQKLQHAAELEIQQLHAVKEELQKESATIKQQLQTSEIRLVESTSHSQEIADRNSKLQAEVAELKEQLHASHKIIYDLQNEQQDLGNVSFENQQLRQAIADLRDQLHTGEIRLGESAREAQEIADRNAKLQNELVELNEQLQLSQKTLAEVQAEKACLEDVKFQNQQLQQATANLQRELQQSESRLSESAKENQEAGDRYARLQSEVPKLKQQLAESQAKARELEAMQHEVAGVESREMIFRDQQSKLEAQVAGLQRELSARQEGLQELDTACKRLAEMDQVCQELRGENHRLNEDISWWQERLAGSEELQKQVSVLRRQLDELQTTRAPLIDRSSALQGARSTGVELTRVSIEPAVTHQITPAVRTRLKRKPRLAMIPALAIVVLAIASTIGVGLLGTSSDQPSEPKQPAVVPQIVSDKPSIPIETAAKTPSRPRPVSATALEKNKTSKQTTKTKPTPQLRGTFEITRPTQVYSAPSEISQTVARIEPGMKVNVVGSRDGWLEVRSMHGRPPGFVRQEAVRIDQKLG